jgi:mannosyl-oligosaccharide alpha-1,2-mannosidase
MLRWRNAILLAAIAATLLLWTGSPFGLFRTIGYRYSKVVPMPLRKISNSPWASVAQQFPVTFMKSLPTSAPKTLPRIQHNFQKEPAAEKKLRVARVDLVKGNFTHAWKGYVKHAWLRDEVQPISGGTLDPFGGWAATLVDSLGESSGY